MFFLSTILSSQQARKMRSDVNFQISRAGLSHPARVLTNQIACFTVVAADRREAAHYSCDTRAQISMPSYV